MSWKNYSCHLDSFIIACYPFFVDQPDLYGSEISFESGVCDIINLLDSNLGQGIINAGRDMVWKWALENGFPKPKGQEASIEEWLRLINLHRSSDRFFYQVSMTTKCRYHGETEKEKLATYLPLTTFLPGLDIQDALDFSVGCQDNKLTRCQTKVTLGGATRKCDAMLEYRAKVKMPQILFLQIPTGTLLDQYLRVNLHGGQYKLISIIYYHQNPSHFAVAFIKERRWHYYDDLVDKGGVKLLDDVPKLTDANFLVYKATKIRNQYSVNDTYYINAPIEGSMHFPSC